MYRKHTCEFPALASLPACKIKQIKFITIQIQSFYYLNIRKRETAARVFKKFIVKSEHSDRT
jgi:hypothetical protein